MAAGLLNFQYQTFIVFIFNERGRESEKGRCINANIVEIFRQLGERLHASVCVVVAISVSQSHCNHNIEYNSIINIIMSFEFLEGVKSDLPHDITYVCIVYIELTIHMLGK